MQCFYNDITGPIKGADKEKAINYKVDDVVALMPEYTFRMVVQKLNYRKVTTIGQELHIDELVDDHSIIKPRYFKVVSIDDWCVVLKVPIDNSLKFDTGIRIELPTFIFKKAEGTLDLLYNG